MSYFDEVYRRYSKRRYIHSSSTSPTAGSVEQPCMTGDENMGPTNMHAMLTALREI